MRVVTRGERHCAANLLTPCSATDAMSRTYARAVNGHDVRMAFNASTADFDLSYTLPANLGAPTVIFAQFVR